MIKTAPSLKARLTALFILIFGGSLIAYSVFIYQTVDKVFESSFDLQLSEFAKDVGESINYSILWGFQFDLRNFTDSQKVFPFTTKEAVIQIRSASGAPLALSKALRGQGLPFSPTVHERVLNGESVYQNWTAEEPVARNRFFRTLTYLVKGTADQYVILQVAVPDRYVRENNKRILRTFLYSIPFLLLVSALIGYSYAAYTLTPINRIIERVKSIRGRNLSERVPVPGTQDEMAQLAVTLNNMLNRVERAFESQERFVSDASHQMKTPLAVLKAHIEELDKRAHEVSADTKEKIHSLGEEVESLIALVNDLLILARVDAGEESLLFSELRMDELVTSVCERLAPIAKRRRISFQLDLKEQPDLASNAGFHVKGDSDLLASLFQSLIENCIKYAPEASKVDITVEESDAYIQVMIRDQGPGIAEEELSTVFERFRRGRSSAQGVSGSGLGLSIAKRISDLHGAELKLSNASDRGLVATFKIKKV